METDPIEAHEQNKEKAEQTRDNVTIFIEEKLEKMPHIFRECSIYRVPKLLLEMNEIAYVPQVISIGPFHHDQTVFKATEELKLRLFNSYRCRVDMDIQGIVEMVRKWEKRARRYYSEFIDMNNDEFVKMMVLDGCFIVELLITDYGNFPKTENMVNSSIYDAIYFAICRDLIMLQNQLPFFVLEGLFDQVSQSPENSVSFEQVVHDFLNDHVLPSVYLQNCPFNNVPNIKPRHLVDFLSHYFVPLGSENFVHRISDLPPTATELREAGVVLKKAEEGRHIMDISFKDGVLTIPPFEIDDSFETYVRNLLAFEQFSMEHFPKDEDEESNEEESDKETDDQTNEDNTKEESDNETDNQTNEENTKEESDKETDNQTNEENTKEESDVAIDVKISDKEETDVAIDVEIDKEESGQEINEKGDQEESDVKIDVEGDKEETVVAIYRESDKEETDMAIDVKSDKKETDVVIDVETDKEESGQEINEKGDQEESDVKIDVEGDKEETVVAIDRESDKEETNMAIDVQSDKEETDVAIDLQNEKKESGQEINKEADKEESDEASDVEIYKQSNKEKNKKYAIHYFEFLDELITTEKDVHLLVKEGIIINSIGGSDKEISELFNGLCKNATIPRYNYFNHISKDLKDHCERRRNRWMASLKHNYFNTPWALISFLAATFLIILTLLQTISSIISIS